MGASSNLIILLVLTVILEASNAMGGKGWKESSKHEWKEPTAGEFQD
jgi:hypothetical protein